MSLLALVGLVLQDALVHKHFTDRISVQVLDIVNNQVVAFVVVRQVNELVERGLLLHRLLADDRLHIA